MNSEKLTASVRQIVSAAQQLAIAAGHQRLSDLHLLKAMMEDDAQAAPRLLARAGANLEALHDDLTTAIGKIPQVSGDTNTDLIVDSALLAVLNAAESW